MEKARGTTIDADYFHTHLLKQIEALGSVAVEVHLHGGVHYLVRRIETAESSYVLLEVYPQGGLDEEARRARTRPTHPGQVLFDRVAVPYASISYVFLTVTDPVHVVLIGSSS